MKAWAWTCSPETYLYIHTITLYSNVFKETYGRIQDLNPTIRSKAQRSIGQAGGGDPAQPLFLLTEAIREYVALNEWQIEETKKALAEADRGDFASEKEVQQTLKKWTRRAG